MEDITYADYRHEKRVSKYFRIKKIGKYHDLYVQIDILLLLDVFENLEISELKYMKLMLLIFYQHLD